jgi:hypothetical protein
MRRKELRTAGKRRRKARQARGVKWEKAERKRKDRLAGK